MTNEKQTNGRESQQNCGLENSCSDSQEMNRSLAYSGASEQMKGGNENMEAIEQMRTRMQEESYNRRVRVQMSPATLNCLLRNLGPDDGRELIKTIAEGVKETHEKYKEEFQANPEDFVSEHGQRYGLTDFIPVIGRAFHEKRNRGRGLKGLVADENSGGNVRFLYGLYELAAGMGALVGTVHLLAPYFQQ